MTRIKRKTARRRKSSYNSQHRLVLLHGIPLVRDRCLDFYPDGEGGRGGYTLDCERVAEAWEEIGEQLLSEYATSHPGRRPFAWWLSRPLRLMIAGEAPPLELIELHPTMQHPPTCFGCPPWARIPWQTFPQVEGESDVEYRRRRGLPTSGMTPDRTLVIQPAVFESEHDYLKRHGLLTDGEIEALNKPEPAAVGD